MSSWRTRKKGTKKQKGLRFQNAAKKNSSFKLKVKPQSTTNKLILYRAYEAEDKQYNLERGIFFAGTKEGAKLYGKVLNKFEVTIKNPVIAKRQSDLYAKWNPRGIKFAYAPFGQTPAGEWISDGWYKRQPESVKTRGAFDNTKWQREIDRRLAIMAKKKGYDAIIYTNPMPPAKREVIVFNLKQIKKL